MRIVGGEWRSRTIEWPDDGRTRPITDRVRESLFAMLGSRLGEPNALPPIGVADIFAGGGSLGLEALSRGARMACFFDRSRAAISILKKNLKKLGAEDRAKIINADVYRGAPAFPAPIAPVDLAFVDPPFVDAAKSDDRSPLLRLLRKLRTAPGIAEDALVVLRLELKYARDFKTPDVWTLEDERHFGRSAVLLLAPAATGASLDSPSESQQPEE